MSLERDQANDEGGEAAVEGGVRRREQLVKVRCDLELGKQRDNLRGSEIVRRRPSMAWFTQGGGGVHAPS